MTHHPQPARRTGCLAMQPPLAATVSCWQFDAHFNYQELGFLDAPEWLPSGGERAEQYGIHSLGIHWVERTA